MYTSDELVQTFNIQVEIYRHHEQTIKPYLACGKLGARLLNKQAIKEFESSKAILIDFLSDITKQGVLITAAEETVRIAAQELIKEFDL